MNTSIQECAGSHAATPGSHNIIGNAEERTKPKLERLLNFRGCGVFVVFLAAVFYSTSATFVKMLDGLHPVQISSSRFAVQFILLLPIITYKRNEEDILGKPGLRKFMWIRGLCGASGMLCLYSAISYLRVGDAVTLSYSKMMFVPFLARILLRETISKLELITALVSFVGVMLIAQPSFLFPASITNDTVNPIGALFGVMAALFQGLSLIVIRKLGNTYPPLSVGYYSICGAIISVPLLVYLQEFQYPCAQDLPFVFSLGFLGVAAQYCLTLALQRERAGLVSVLSSVQLIIVNVLQVFLLGAVPSVLSIIGTSLILFCSVILGVAKIRQKTNK